MKSNKKLFLLVKKLDHLAATSPFYVDYGDLDRLRVFYVRIGLRPQSIKQLRRPTCTDSGERSMAGHLTVLFAVLSDDEKDLICDLICGIADKVGMKRPKLLSKNHPSVPSECKDSILVYYFYK